MKKLILSLSLMLFSNMFSGNYLSTFVYDDKYKIIDQTYTPPVLNYFGIQIKPKSQLTLHKNSVILGSSLAFGAICLYSYKIITKARKHKSISPQEVAELKLKYKIYKKILLEKK